VTNHPNRRRRPPGCDPKPGETPLPRQIRERREAAGLTQNEAGALVHHSERAWQNWEEAQRAMSPSTWELFCIKSEGLVLQRRATA
jgi:DNA-binding transcriptional regulator YiaG